MIIAVLNNLEFFISSQEELNKYIDLGCDIFIEDRDGNHSKIEINDNEYPEYERYKSPKKISTTNTNTQSVENKIKSISNNSSSRSINDLENVNIVTRIEALETQVQSLFNLINEKET